MFIRDMSFKEAFDYVNNQSYRGCNHDIVQSFEVFEFYDFVLQFFEGKSNTVILEIGSYTGGNLSLLSKTLTTDVGFLISIEPELEVSFLRPLVQETISPATLIHLPMFSTDYLTLYLVESLIHKIGRITLLFIDGNHGYEACKSDVEQYLPFMNSPGILALHDIYLEQGVQTVYKELIESTDFKHLEFFSDLNGIGCLLI